MNAPPAGGAPVESDAILERLKTLHPKLIDLSLGRMTGLLARLGHPERAMPRVIHIAGTNGKGSVLAYLDAILRADGRRVNAYISPHLVRFAERIRLNGISIGEAALAAHLEACEAVNAGAPITFFEITTAAAFLAYRDNPADWLLLEVGLGGRLDATNVIDRPALSVITPVSIDHREYLGDTLPQIAFEKAGILKPGVPAVVGPQVDAALGVIEDQAAAVGSPLFVRGRDYQVAAEGGNLHFSAGGTTQIYPRPALAGAHQIENAGIALACLHVLRAHGIRASAIGEGLRGARWPGRLQHLEDTPDGWSLWLDGGHNAAAGHVLGAVAAEWADRPLYLIMGMLNTKDPAGFLAPLAPHAATLTALAVPGEPASEKPEVLVRAAEMLGLPATAAAGVNEALDALRRTQPPGRVLICGSLYLAGRVLAARAAQTKNPAG